MADTNIRLNVDASGAESGFQRFTKAMQGSSSALQNFDKQAQSVFGKLGKTSGDPFADMAKNIAKLNKAMSGFQSSSGQNMARTADEMTRAVDKLAQVNAAGVARAFGAIRREFAKIGAQRINTTGLMTGVVALQSAISRLSNLNTANVAKNLSEFARASNRISNMKFNVGNVAASVTALQQAVTRFSAINLGPALQRLQAFSALRVPAATANSIVRLSAAMQVMRGPNPQAIASLQQFVHLVNSLDTRKVVAMAAATRNMSTAARAAGAANKGVFGNLFSGSQRAVTGLRGLENAFNASYQASTLLRQALGDLSVGMVIKGIMESGRAYSTLRLSVDAVAVSAKETASQLEYVNQLAKDLPVAREAAMESYGKFAVASRLSGVSASTGQSIFKSFSEAFTVLHLTEDAQKNAFLAVEQMYSKGKIQAEELRKQLGNYLPGAFEILAQAMGVTTAKLSQMMQNGEVGTENIALFANKLHEMFGAQVPAAMQSSVNQATLLMNRFSMLKTAIFEGGFDRGLSNMFQKITAALDSQGIDDIGQRIGGAFERAFEAVGKGIVFIIEHWQIFAGLLAAFVATSAFGTLMSLGTMIGGPLMRIALPAVRFLAKHIGGLPVAIAAATAGMLLFKDAVIESNGHAARLKDYIAVLWSDLTSPLKPALDVAQNAWEGFTNWLDNKFNGLVTKGRQIADMLPGMPSEGIDLTQAQKVYDTSLAKRAEARMQAELGEKIKPEEIARSNSRQDRADANSMLGHPTAQQLTNFYRDAAAEANKRMLEARVDDSGKKQDLELSGNQLKALDKIKAENEAYEKNLKLLEAMKNAQEDDPMHVNIEQYEKLKRILDETTLHLRDPFAAMKKEMEEETAALKGNRAENAIEQEFLERKSKLLKDHVDMTGKEVELRAMIVAKHNADSSNIFKDLGVSPSIIQKASPIDKAREEYRKELEALNKARALPEGNQFHINDETYQRSVKAAEEKSRQSRDPYKYATDEMNKQIAIQQLSKEQREVENKVLEKKNELIKQGVSFDGDSGKQLEENLRRTTQALVTAEKGGATGFQQWAHDADSLTESLNKVEKDGIGSLSDALADFIVDGKNGFADLAKSIDKMIVKAILNNWIKQLIEGTGGAGGFSLAGLLGGGAKAGAAGGGGMLAGIPGIGAMFGGKPLIDLPAAMGLKSATATQQSVQAVLNSPSGASPMAGATTKAAQSVVQALSGGKGAFSTAGNYNGQGVDPKLTDILKTTAERGGYSVQAISGLRPGDPRFHGRGMATDVNLLGPDGKPILGPDGNYQNPEAFRAYEKFAQDAKRVQMEKYPELEQDFRWGGYFSGGKGKYGAMDSMHFDLGGKRVGMGGGSWANGLTPEQRKLFPGAESAGMGGDFGGQRLAAAAAKQVNGNPMPGTGNELSALDKAKGLVRRYESAQPGGEAKAYWDQNSSGVGGAWRVGYGSGTVTDPATGKFRTTQQGDVVTKEMAEADLHRRMTGQFDQYGKTYGDSFQKIGPNAQASVASVGWNYGRVPASVDAAIRSGDPNKVSEAISGLSANKWRRQQEAAFAKGENPVPTVARAGEVKREDLPPLEKLTVERPGAVTRQDLPPLPGGFTSPIGQNVYNANGFNTPIGQNVYNAGMPRIDPEVTGSISNTAQQVAQQTQQQVQQMQQQIQQAVPNLTSMTQGVGQLSTNLAQGVPQVGNFGDSIQQMLSKLFSGGGGGGGGGGLGSLFSGLFGGGGGGTGGLYKEGGFAGSPVSSMSLPSSSWSGAPHFSEGGTTVPGGGIPAVLHDNEAVIPLSRGREVPVKLTGNDGNANNGSGPANITIKQTVNTPDANSFRQSRRQIHADMARSLQIAHSRNN